MWYRKQTFQSSNINPLQLSSYLYISASVFLVLLCLYELMFMGMRLSLQHTGVSGYAFLLCMNSSSSSSCFRFVISFKNTTLHIRILSISCRIEISDLSFRRCMMAGILWNTLTQNLASLFLKEIMVGNALFMTLDILPTPSTISGYALESILINDIDTGNATDASVTEVCTYG